jgi:hypothetical protein
MLVLVLALVLVDGGHALLRPIGRPDANVGMGRGDPTEQRPVMWGGYIQLERDILTRRRLQRACFFLFAL